MGLINCVPIKSGLCLIMLNNFCDPTPERVRLRMCVANIHLFTKSYKMKVCTNELLLYSNYHSANVLYFLEQFYLSVTHYYNTILLC